MLRFPLALPLLALAACDGKTSISIDGDNVSVHSGVVMNEADLDLNGVQFYPGSSIRDFRLDAQDRKGGKDSARTAVQFEAGAPLAKVQAWYRDELRKAGYSVAPNGEGFTGTKGANEKVELELAADGAARTKGRMVVTD